MLFRIAAQKEEEGDGQIIYIRLNVHKKKEGKKIWQH